MKIDYKPSTTIRFLLINLWNISLNANFWLISIHINIPPDGLIYDTLDGIKSESCSFNVLLNILHKVL